MSENSNPVVLVLGDVMTDIVARLHEPLRLASDTESSIGVRAGGSAANMAVWLAQANQKLAVHFIGRVGRDHYGDFHRREFEQAGVQPHLALDPTLVTGTIVVLVEHTGGERSFLTDRGANLGLSLEDLPLELFQSAKGGHFHLSAYTLFEPKTRTVALQALELARQNRLTISIDPSSTSLLTKVGPAQFLEWTKGATLCFPNLEEGRLLTGESQPQAIVKSLASWYGATVLKLGAAGAIWGKQAAEPMQMKPKLFPQTAVIDTTGAGDAFCAGFLSQWLKNGNTHAALEAGVALASLATSRIGARPH